MTHANALLILVDALRYDIVADSELRRVVTPNLDRLVQEGELGKVVSQASNTQFAMPSIMSGTAPLDYGGYNEGCKKRPACFPESFLKRGYKTALFSNCVLYNRDLGFDRGFVQAVVPINNRRALKQDIEYRLRVPIRKWQEGELPDTEIVRTLQREFRDILENLIRVCEDVGRTPRRFKRLVHMNRELAIDARRECALLERDPLAVLEKLKRVPETYYWAVLGLPRPNYRLLAVRILNKIYAMIGSLVPARILRFGHFDGFESLVEELAPGVSKFVGNREQPWFVMAHIMDVHTNAVCLNQLLRAPSKILRRLFLSRKLISARDSRGRRPDLLYLLGLAVVDEFIGNLTKALDETVQRERTVIMVIADHGRTQERYDLQPTPELSRRFRRSCLETPLVLAGSGDGRPLRAGLRDSRDIGATLLDRVGLAIPDGYRGRSVLSSPPRRAVVSENAGRGYCDLERDDLNFAVTGPSDKLLAVLHGSELHVTDLHDLDEDPDELTNLAGKPGESKRAAHLLEFLWQKRGDILSARGCQSPLGDIPVAGSYQRPLSE